VVARVGDKLEGLEKALEEIERGNQCGGGKRVGGGGKGGSLEKK
jgi:hypothetical protein